MLYGTYSITPLFLDNSPRCPYNKVVYGPDLYGERMPEALLQGASEGFPGRSF